MEAILVPVALSRLLALKGQFASIRTIRPIKVKKGCAEILKDSTFLTRVGIIYDNMHAVQVKRAEGILPEKNAGLPWGKWFLAPHLIEHNGTHYFRCNVVRNENQIPKVVFTRDGVEITKDEAKLTAYASEFPTEPKDNDCFTIKIENIIAINGEVL